MNAPKAGPPQYIAYPDVCYSSSEARPSQIYLQHIMQWNMLLVSSANSIDISFLRVTQTGDLPIWTQEYPNDMYPADLPLTASQDESFPVGVDIDLGCSKNLLGDDGNSHPIMPMVHILSTYGVLCSFYILNTTPTYVSICSPPRPIDPQASSLFKAVQTRPAVSAPQQQQQVPQQQQQQPPQQAPQHAQPQLSELLKTPSKVEFPFAPVVQSTPAIQKVQPMAVKPPATNLFSGGSLLGMTAQPAQIPFSGLSPFQTVAKTTAPAVIPTQNVAPSQPAPALITVPQNYTPQAAPVNNKPEARPSPVEKVNTPEDEQLYARMIQDEIKAFELELRTVMEKSRSLRVNIGTKEESADMRRSLEELDELKKEATETIDSLRTDVQSNRLGITEMFSMVYEARAKFDQSRNEKSIFMHQNQVQDRASKRTLDRLVKQVSQCEMQLQVAVQVMNSQWANYQEALNKSKKNRMHNPSLEGLYQTLTKQQEIIYRQNEKMALLKSKLGLRDNINKQKFSTLNPTMESFSDSMISISLADQVQKDNSRLTNKKLKNLRNLLANNEVVTIRPQRPERLGLNSEIIREKKLQTMKTMKKPHAEPVKRTADQAQKSNVPVPQSQGVPFNMQPKSMPFAAQSQDHAPAPSFGLSNQPSGLSFGAQTMQGFGSPQPFGGSTIGSSFGIASLTANTKPSQGLSFGVATSSTPAPVLSFGLNSSGSKPSFGLSTAPLILGSDKPTPSVPLGASNQDQKVFSGAPSKPPSTIANANVAVSATFSIPLANKVTSGGQKEPSKVVEKKQDENKPPSTNENASFTFKMSDKKEESPVVTIKAPAGAPVFSLTSTDPSKGFSFGASTAPPSFGVTAKSDDLKPKPVAATTTSVFSGFGNVSTTTSSSSAFGAGSGFSLNLGSDATKTAFGGTTGFSLNLGADTTSKPAFSLNLTSSSDAPKPTATPNFSFASAASDMKPTAAATTAPTSSSFSFSGALAQTSTAKTSEAASVPATTSS